MEKKAEEREVGRKEEGRRKEETSQTVLLTVSSLVLSVLVHILKVLQGLYGEEVLLTLLGYTLRA